MNHNATCLCLILCSLLAGPALAADDAQAEQGEHPLVSRSQQSAVQILAALEEPSGWALIKRSEREGVRVYKKDLAGFDIPAFRGEKVVAVASDRLFAMLVDFNSHAGMSDRVPLAISEVLKVQGDSIEFFQLVDTPSWTMARDRAWFNRAVVSRNHLGEAGRHRQTWETLTPEHYPDYWQAVLKRYPRVLHLSFSFGSWEVLPVGPESTRLIYTIITHPGGRIPDGLHSFVTGQTLPDNLLQFEEAALRQAGR